MFQKKKARIITQNAQSWLHSCIQNNVHNVSEHTKHDWSLRKVHEEARLQHLIHNTVEKKVLNLFRTVYAKNSTGTYTNPYKTVEQATAKEIYFGGAEVIMRTKVENLTNSQASMKRVIHKNFQGPTFTASGIRLVKEHAEIIVSRQAKFRDCSFEQERNNNETKLPSPHTGRSKDS